MTKHPQKRTVDTAQSGFTIIELLIATIIFSMILIVILYGVLSFTHAYYSGVNSSTTQDVTRTITNDIAQAVQFSGNDITPTTVVSGSTYYLCAGGATYYFVEGALYDGATPTAADPGLYQLSGTCTSSPSFSSSSGKELLGPSMRVTYLGVTQSAANPRLYDVHVGLAYGASDLLCSVSKNGSTGGCLRGDALNPQGISVKGTGVNDVECRLTTGSQFCAHAGLSTIVSLRVANSELVP